MKNKIFSLMMACLLVVGSLLPFTAQTIEADSVTVDIVSYKRGAQKDLRSSELLYAKVEGYTGDPSKLTYEWINDLGPKTKNMEGTYLYVYNSANLDGIEGTIGEIEIHNTEMSVKPSSDMQGRTYNKYFSGQGYAYAAVYGKNVTDSKEIQNITFPSVTRLSGNITVIVRDENGTEIARDTHTGTFDVDESWLFLFTFTYTPHGIVKPNIKDDLKYAHPAIGLFEGETLTGVENKIKSLLAQDSIVHATSSNTEVSLRKTSNKNYVTISNDKDGTLVGKKAGTSTSADGDSKITYRLNKENDIFHEIEYIDSTLPVFVYKEPSVVEVAADHLTIGNIDSRCDYLLNNSTGTKNTDGTITFNNLIPNTTYEMTIVGNYTNKDNKAAEVYLTKEFTTAPIDGVALYLKVNGKLTNIEDFNNYSKYEDEQVRLHAINVNDEADRTTLIPKDGLKGIYVPYTGGLPEGQYYIYTSTPNDNYSNIIDYLPLTSTDYILDVKDGKGALNLNYVTIEYDYNGGSNGPTTTEVLVGEETSLSHLPAYYEGRVFRYWTNNNNIYYPSQKVTLNEKLVLTAAWEKYVSAYVNVTIDHTTLDGGIDVESNEKDDVKITVIEQHDSSDLTHDTLTFNKNNARFDYEEERNSDNRVIKSTYKSKVPTFEQLNDVYNYTVLAEKAGYKTDSVTATKDANGNWIIDVKLIFSPEMFAFEFDVEFKKGESEYYDTDAPDAVVCKVLYFDRFYKTWEVISQHANSDGVIVELDDNTGKGTGSYPVWRNDQNGDPYIYRIQVESVIYDGVAYPIINELEEHKEYTSGNFDAVIKTEDGKKYSGTSLKGAYYDGKQKGEVKAELTSNIFDVTFILDGGKLFDKGGETFVVNSTKYLPDIDDDNFKPVKEGYDFKAWYYDENLTQRAVADSVLTSDVTLYPEYWKEDAELINVNYTVKHVAANQVIDEALTKTNTISIPKYISAVPLEPRDIQAANLKGYAFTDTAILQLGEYEKVVTYDDLKTTRVTDGTVVKLIYEVVDVEYEEVTYCVEYTSEDDDFVNEGHIYYQTVEKGETEMEIQVGSVERKSYDGYSLVAIEVNGVSNNTIKDGDKIEKGSTVKFIYDKITSEDTTAYYVVEHKYDDILMRSDIYSQTISAGATNVAIVNDSLEPMTVEGLILSEVLVNGQKVDVTTLKDVPLGAKITFVYTMQSTETKEVYYTVKHMLEGVEQTSDTVKVSRIVPISAPNYVLKDLDSLQVKDYQGYKFEEVQIVTDIAITYTDLETLLTYNGFDSGIEIHFIYELDETQTKNTTYTVRYIWQSEEAGVIIDHVIEEKEHTQSVWVNDETQKVKDNTANLRTFKGYTFKEVQLNGVATNLENLDEIPLDSTITFVYTQNPTQDDEGDELHYYYVEHVVDGVLKDTTTHEAALSDAENVVVNPETIKPNTYEDYYVFDRYEVNGVSKTLEELTNVASGATIKLIYNKSAKTKDISYTVMHYFDGVLDNSYTQTIVETVWINTNELKVTADSIKPIEKDGFTFTHFAPEDVQAGDLVAHQTVIEMHYSSEYEYRIEYYYDGILENIYTEVNKANFGDSVSYTDKLKENYIFSYTENYPLTITQDESQNVIKVYYLKDEVGGQNGGDNIPDLYQKAITVVIENGYWTTSLYGTSTNPYVFYVTLKEGDNLSENGQAEVEHLLDPLVEKMAPKDGYKNEGAWSPSIKTPVSGNKPITYTYKFIKDEPSKPETKPTTPSDGYVVPGTGVR